MGHDANYVEERVLQPLQRAVALMREADKLDVLIRQRQELVNELKKGEEGLKRKHAEWNASIEAMKASAAQQRQELQAQLHADRLTREAERKRFEQERETLREQQRTEQMRLADLARDRQAAEAELTSIKKDITQRLQALQGVAR